MTQANIFAGLTAEQEKKAAAAAKRAATIAKKKAEAAAAAAQISQEQEQAQQVKAEQAAPVCEIEQARKAFVNACLLRQAKANAINAEKGVGECKTIVSDLAFFGYNDANNADYARKILAKMQEIGFDLQAVAAHIANTEAGKGKPYLAVKAITKARQMFTAIATNDLTKFDGYTYAVLVNMVQTGRALDSHEMMQCVSKSVKAHAAKSKGVPVETIKNSSINTANTQVCSTRGFLGDLQILKVQKGKQGDAPEWADNQMANVVRAWFVKHCNE